jgi:sirohydrochlorin ferrochelatase
VTEALLAVAHGSRDPRHAAAVEALAARVRSQRPGLRVEAAYLDHCGPTAARALHGLVREGYRDVSVVPLLLNTAYHVRQDIPAAVAEAHAALPARWRRAVPRPRVAGPLGPHPLLVEAMEHRLREAGIWPGDEEVAVVLGWAGSSDRAAAAAVAGVAKGWEQSGWRRVLPIPAEGDLAGEAVRALRLAGVDRVVVAPYFLAPGFLADRVRDGALAAGADVVAGEIADAPEAARVVWDRYDSAVGSARLVGVA